MDHVPPALTIFLPLFLLFWYALFTVISNVGGWRELAERYRAQVPFEGRKWRFLSGRMRKLIAYNNSLTLGGDRRGMFLAVSFFFFPNHPSLFIPWGDLSVLRRQEHGGELLEFRFTRVPEVYLLLPGEVGEMLLALREGREPKEGP